MATINLGNVSMVSDGDYVPLSPHNKNHYVYVAADNITYVSLKDNNSATPTNDHINWQTLCAGIGVTTDNNFTDSYKTKLEGVALSATNTAPSSTNGDIKINNVDTTVYTHPSTDGNHHVPVTSTTNNGKVLKAGATAGSESWGTLTALDVGAIPTTQKGVASGVASTNANNQVIQDSLNALSLGGNLASLYPTILSGAWTPTIYGSTTAGSPIYTTQIGNYYKIGRLVFIRCAIQISSLGGATGALKIGGIPFAVSVEGTLNISGATGFNISAGSVIGVGRIVLSEIDLNYSNNSVVYGLDASLVTSSLSIFGATGLYLAAS